MDSQGSVTKWLAELREGDRTGAHQELWNRYFGRLVGLARRRLRDTPRGAIDEEDVALSALGSFFENVRRGHYPELSDRTGLWSLLASITARKAINQWYFERCAKRGAGRVRSISIAEPRPYRGNTVRSLEMLSDNGIPPDELAAISEECRRLMDALSSDQLRQIAQMKLEGYTNHEIAEEIGVVERTIERKLKIIRNHWSTVS